MNYYYANDNNQPAGPHTADQMQLLYRQGTLHDNSWVIEEGSAQWNPYAELFQPACREGQNQSRVKRCKNCSAENAEDAQFCGECGTKLAIALAAANSALQSPRAAPAVSTPPLPSAVDARPGGICQAAPAGDSERRPMNRCCPHCQSNLRLRNAPRLHKIIEWISRPIIIFWFGLAVFIPVLLALLCHHAYYGYYCESCGKIPFRKLPARVKLYTSLLRLAASPVVGLVASFVLLIPVGIVVEQYEAASKAAGEVTGEVASVSIRTDKPVFSSADNPVIHAGVRGSSSSVVMALKNVTSKRYSIALPKVLEVQGFEDLKPNSRAMGGLLILTDLQKRLIGKHVELTCTKAGNDDDVQLYTISELKVEP